MSIIARARPTIRRKVCSSAPSARDENHWFRQDIDAYLHNLAIHYGAVPRQKTRVTGLRSIPAESKLQTSTGEEIRARYLVDGTGYRSILADRFGLRENPTRLKHHSRTLFTHMVDVPPFDDAHNPLPISYHNGTLHHCFERGWFWVIPFNNNPLSTNPIISVGLTIDPRRYPKPEMSAEQEFNEFLQRLSQCRRAIQGCEGGSALGIYRSPAVFLQKDNRLSLLSDVTCLRVYGSTFLPRHV